MIIFGDQNIVPFIMGDPNRYFLLNFFNVVNLGTPLTRLMAPPVIFQTCPIDSVNFSGAYANFVISNDEAFQDFMEIVMAMYYNDDVFVLTDLQSTHIVAMAETIIKIIQQRYGYNCYILNTIDDIFSIPQSEMSEIGSQIFLSDKERYVRLTVDAKKLLENIEVAGGPNDQCI